MADYTRCRICRHYATTSVHLKLTAVAYHEFMPARPHELPEGFAPPTWMEKVKG